MSRLLDLSTLEAENPTITSASLKKIRTFAGAGKNFELVPAAQALGAKLGRGELRMFMNALKFFGEKYNSVILDARDAREVAVRKSYNKKRRDATKARNDAKKEAENRTIWGNQGDDDPIYTPQTIEKIADLPAIRDLGESDPFSVTVKSAVAANVSRTFQFNCRTHFERWASKCNENEEIHDSMWMAGNTGPSGRAGAMDIVTATVSFGGARDNTRAMEREFKTPYYTFKVFDPKSANNNCGIKVVESILGTKLDTIECRKFLDIAPGVFLTPKNLHSLYERFEAGPELTIIGDDFDGDFEGNAILLHNEHYYHVKEAVRVINKDKKTKRGNLFWDIETRKSHKHTIMIGSTQAQLLVPAILSMVWNDYKSITKQKHTFIGLDCCEQFKAWLSKQATGGKTYNCYSHNGSRFDHYLLYATFNKNDILESEIQLRGTSIIGLQYKSHLFKDTCCFLVNSLSNLCKGYCTTPEEKAFAKQETFTLHNTKVSNTELCFYRPELDATDFLELQHSDPEFWELYVKYCEYDCESLKIVWEKFEAETNASIGVMGQWVLARVKVNSCNTIGSLAKKILDTTNNLLIGQRPGWDAMRYNMFLRISPFKPAIDEKKYKFLKNFKRGGISHCNQPGKHNEGVMGVDIKSQYPTALMNMEIPVGESRWVTKEETGHGFYELKNCVFEGRKFKPVAKALKGESLDWATNIIPQLFADSFMLDYLKTHSGLVSYEVVDGLLSNEFITGEQLFGPYVSTLYKIKEEQDELKATKSPLYNQAKREVVKLLLNSVTGKLVEDPSTYFRVQFDDAGKTALNGVSCIKDDTETKTKSNTWIVAGCMVYSYSKRLLFEYIDCLPNKSDDVIHVETDGIYFPLPLRDEFKANVAAYAGPFKEVMIGDKLGNIEVEIEQPGTSYWLGKKFYYIKTAHLETKTISKHAYNDEYEIDYLKSKIRLKGIPTRTIDSHGRNIDLINEHFFEDIYAGLEIITEFAAISKSLFDSKQSKTVSMHAYQMSRTTRGRLAYKEYF
jgi:hypothetical protein